MPLCTANVAPQPEHASSPSRTSRSSAARAVSVRPPSAWQRGQRRVGSSDGRIGGPPVSLSPPPAARAPRHETALLFGGDDRAILGLVQELAGGDGREWARAASRHVAALAPELAATRTPEWFLTAGREEGRHAGASACKVSTTLARRLGLPLAVQPGLDQVYERWDGTGPGSVGGEQLCVPARVSHVVDVVEIAFRAGGVPAARELIRRRTGSHFDPAIAELFDRRADDLLDGLDEVDVLEAALDAEPTPQPRCRDRSSKAWRARSRTSPT